jgi:hypothetical protein
MNDPFVVADPPKKNVRVLQGEVARGDDWIICKTGREYKLSYLSGHFATKEKEVVISDSDAEQLLNDTLAIHDLIKKYDAE